MTTIADLLAEFLEHLTNERQLAANTVRTYQLDLLQIHEFVGRKPFAAVELSDLRRFMRQMKADGWKGSTTRRKLHALSTFYEFQMLNGLVSDNIARQAQRLAPKRKREVQRKLLTTDEWRRFALTPAENVRDTVAWGLLAWLGVRSSELRSIRLRDVEITAGTIVIAEGKGGNQRRLPLPPALTDGVQMLMWQRKPDDYLLRGDDGGYWNKDPYYEAFKAHLQRCDLGDHITPHWLRHTVASNLAGQLHVFELREWMGHVSTRTTELYVHTSASALRNAMNKHPLADNDK